MSFRAVRRDPLNACRVAEDSREYQPAGVRVEEIQRLVVHRAVEVLSQVPDHPATGLHRHVLTEVDQNPAEEVDQHDQQRNLDEGMLPSPGIDPVGGDPLTDLAQNIGAAFRCGLARNGILGRRQSGQQHVVDQRLDRGNDGAHQRAAEPEK